MRAARAPRAPCWDQQPHLCLWVTWRDWVGPGSIPWTAAQHTLLRQHGAGLSSPSLVHTKLRGNPTPCLCLQAAKASPTPCRLHPALLNKQLARSAHLVPPPAVCLFLHNCGCIFDAVSGLWRAAPGESVMPSRPRHPLDSGIREGVITASAVLGVSGVLGGVGRDDPRDRSARHSRPGTQFAWHGWCGGCHMAATILSACCLTCCPRAQYDRNGQKQITLNFNQFVHAALHL